MRNLLLLLMTYFTVVSCASRPKPLPLLPVPSSAATAPAVAAIRPGLDRAGNAAAGLDARAGLLEKHAADARAGAATLAEEAARLAKAGAATAAELARVSQAAGEQRDRAARLASDLTEARATITELNGALADARIAQADALATASAGDDARRVLTQQVQAVTTQYQTAEADREKLTRQAAGAAVYKHWLIAIALAIAAWLFLAYGLRSLKPL